MTFRQLEDHFSTQVSCESVLSFCVFLHQLSYLQHELQFQPPKRLRSCPSCVG